jgi:hypothetical protein
MKILSIKLNKILLLLIINISAVVFGQKIEPTIGIKYPTDSPMRDYYDRNFIITYGMSCVFLRENSHFGFYFKYSREKFDIYDVKDNKYQIKISNSIFAVGLQKNINIIRFRMGLTKHFDNLMIFDMNDNRIGYSISLGYCYNLNNNFKFYIDSEYEYEELKVPIYYDYYDSRHRKYLSGKRFNTGGLTLSTSLSF